MTRRRVLLAVLAVLALAAGLVLAFSRGELEDGGGVLGETDDGDRSRPALPRGGSVPATSDAVEYTGELLVGFEPGTTARAADAAVDAVDGQLEERIRKLGVSVVDVPDAELDDAAAELERRPDVAYVEQDVVVRGFGRIPSDELWSTQAGLAKIRAPEAWDLTTGSRDVVVAVIDTGVDGSHPDLLGALVPGWDVIGNDADASDDHGHGTGAAGVVAERANNRIGAAGVCWSCSIMPVKVLDGSGYGATSDVAAGIVWAVDHGADVVSMSLGGAGTTQTLTDAIAYAASKGVILVAGAGNSGNSTPMYPAAYPEVIAVAATNETDALHSWSNYGDWVDVAAPGCNPAPAKGGSYATFCGTSSAAPVVSGLAGLALSVRPGAGRADVERAITQAAVKVNAAVVFGRVDAGASLALLAPERAPSPAQQPATAPARARVAPRARPATSVVSGRARGRRGYARAVGVGAGSVATTVTFPRGERLSLSVLAPNGSLVAQARGTSPLRLRRTLRGGSYRFVVRAGARERVPFTLTVMHPRRAAKPSR